MLVRQVAQQALGPRAGFQTMAPKIISVDMGTEGCLLGAAGAKTYSSVRDESVSSLNSCRRRWTTDLYRRCCFKTNNDATRFSRTELGQRSHIQRTALSIFIVEVGAGGTAGF